MLDPGNSALPASSPIHHYFLLIFSVFYCYFSSRKALCSIFGSVHWTLKEYPSIMTIIPTFTILLVFFIQHSYTFLFGNVRWTLNTMPNMVTNHPPFFPLFFRIFFTILLLFFIQHSHTFHIWKCALDPENSAQCCHQQ